MKPKNAFSLLKDIQQLFIIHLDQASYMISTYSNQYLTESIAPAGQRSQTSLRIEKLEHLFYLSDQTGKME